MSTKDTLQFSARMALALSLIYPAGEAFACASCGCSLNTDASAQGVSATSGRSLDVRLDAINQNQLRTGTGTISPTAAALTNDPTIHGPAEVEQYTNNQYLTAAIDYNQGDSWGVTVSVPYITRSHSTLGEGSDGVTYDPANGAYQSQASGLGDVRVVGRYYGFSDARNTGIQLGLKLPTGGTSQLGADGVTPVDPGLQLGTGTTDVILGAYHFDNINQDWSYFVQGQFQYALAPAYNSVNAGTYRPGDSLNLTGGVRYHGFEGYTPEVQVNVRNVNTDSGTAADTFSTGGVLVYLTPGVTVPVNAKLSVRANVQIPLYQNLYGIQLAPTAVYSVGAKYLF